MIMNRACISLTVLLLVGLGDDAQAQRSPAPVRYGKWALLAGSVALNVAAAGAHNDADRAFGLLEERCEADRALCDVDVEGRYIDVTSEDLYQESLRHDRKSRKLLFGGEAALLGSAVLFIWEFARPKSPPANIPFEPEVSVRNGVTKIGMRVAW